MSSAFLAQEAASDLFDFLIMYRKSKVENVDNVRLKEHAKRINARYAGASSFLSQQMNNYISRLVDYFVDTGLPFMTDDEVDEAIGYLSRYYRECAR